MSDMELAISAGHFLNFVKLVKTAFWNSFNEQKRTGHTRTIIVGNSCSLS
jgi:hypothetical protein